MRQWNWYLNYFQNWVCGIFALWMGESTSAWSTKRCFLHFSVDWKRKLEGTYLDHVRSKTYSADKPFVYFTISYFLSYNYSIYTVGRGSSDRNAIPNSRYSLIYPSYENLFPHGLHEDNRILVLALNITMSEVEVCTIRNVDGEYCWLHP
jgi:hypothetical protein